jgi:hypothetical protein
MQDNELQNVTKTIRFTKSLSDKIDELRAGTERSFAQQVKLMLKKYIEIIDIK